ncbi:hypothetical protein VTN77DRAFT_7220 [Rasamsonia byssochlamydoides]|uniref:uncharacterized protein n=1 Tax=Rasamsonia byssochlamydoides TaxID=89139 RepID=UPI003742082D
MVHCRWRGLLLSSIWSLLWTASEQAAFQFVNPPAQDAITDNPVYTVGSYLNIQWVSSEDDFLAMRMVHQLSTVDEYIYVFENVSGLSAFSWQIQLGTMNLSITPEFFLDIFIQGQTTPSAWSHNFNLTESASTSTSTTPTTTSSSSTTSTTLPATTTSSGSDFATSSSSSPPVIQNDGLSTGAKVGIGVGVGVTVTIIASLAAGLFFIARYRKRKNTVETSQNPVNNTRYYPVTPPPYKPPPQVSQGPPQDSIPELPGEDPTPHEMPHDSRL